jgi:hypothetical protein
MLGAILMFLPAAIFRIYNDRSGEIVVQTPFPDVERRYQQDKWRQHYHGEIEEQGMEGAE